ncbi:MAG: hypothetical protein DRR08_30815 [Candidatus Parabeggiatoa sp. nov. 2]|nr:MAG: hypothetical protein DRR08_30815 [Gammaproteobacteria bacterium]
MLAAKEIEAVIWTHFDPYFCMAIGTGLRAIKSFLIFKLGRGKFIEFIDCGKFIEFTEVQISYQK